MGVFLLDVVLETGSDNIYKFRRKLVCRKTTSNDLACHSMAYGRLGF
jgi:hypothetical protein